MHTVSAGLSDLGKEREQNEDSFAVDDELGFYAVSDGMGGHAAGEVASSLAIQIAQERVELHRSVLKHIALGEADARQLVSIAREAVESACEAVYRKAISDASTKGMGCTLTLVLIAGPHAVLGHVGDSRCYLVRGEQVHQLSSDHTVAGELARAGHITPAEVKTHKYAHALTRAIGPQEAVQAELLAFTVAPEDRVVLCSDGLSEYIDDPQWLAPQVADPILDAVVETLIQHANSGGGRDNITALVVRACASPQTKDAVLSLAEDVKIQIDAISAVPAFEDLPLGHLSRTLNHCRVVAYEAGARVFAAGDPWSALVVVLDGSFSLQAAGAEDRILRPGDHLGASALLTSRVTSSSLSATASGRLLVLDSEAFQSLVRDRPWLGVALLSRIGRQLGADLQKCNQQAAKLGASVLSSEWI